MKLFNTSVFLTSGDSIDVDVHLDWHTQYEGNDYDFDFSLWHKGQRVLDDNIIPDDVEKITNAVDSRLTNATH